MVKRDSLFYSKISKLRKNRVGGQTFKDSEIARQAQIKSVEARRHNAENKDRRSGPIIQPLDKDEG